ncbi:hypothetical protein IMZ48_10745 [Candidatus Bathyarchaeota archaeon]|nr:hypothetical protein [Candidatus Bathyarchaeota archaeon]
MFPHPFDLIVARALSGCFKDPADFIEQAYEYYHRPLSWPKPSTRATPLTSRSNLEPGGYLELQDYHFPYASDDGTLKKDNILFRVSSLVIDAAATAGRPIDCTPDYKSLLEKKGFVDVVERCFKWPLNDWPRDPHHKELGNWQRETLHAGVEGLIMALFTRYLGWAKEEVLVAGAQFRAALKDRSVHAYVPM